MIDEIKEKMMNAVKERFAETCVTHYPLESRLVHQLKEEEKITEAEAMLAFVFIGTMVAFRMDYINDEKGEMLKPALEHAALAIRGMTDPEKKEEEKDSD